MRQRQALNVMMGGANVFLTGAPGAGKTYVLNGFIQRAIAGGKRVAVTASTGIAATHIGGTTIHSWSGLGIREQLTAQDRRWLAANDRLIKRYNGTDILVIDEISMLHGRRLDMINEAAKLLRDSQAPFGGLQVILVGDLFQLPPINRGGEALDFVHSSAAWGELNPQICYLTEQHRQSDSDGLLNLLEAMRSGALDTLHQELIQSRLDRKPTTDLTVTRLYSHNIDVEAINQQHLAALTAQAKAFYMQTKGNKARLEQLTKSVLAPEVLTLKVGAEVMFVANDFSQGFVNGSRGRVIDFDGDTPLVRLMNGRVIHVESHTWSLSEDGRVQAEVVQLPLRLAWAITIHKSQGMSLDAAEIDLAKAFTPGMGYVALSRVRSLEGLYLQGINATALRMHPEIHEFDRLLRQASDNLAAQVDDFIDAGPSTEINAGVQNVDEVLFEKLKKWRFQRAQADHVSAFMIAHNTALTAVAATAPTTPQQLLALPGFGKRKVESYGSDILAIVSEHATTTK